MSETLRQAERGLFLAISGASQARPEVAAELYERTQLQPADFSSPALGQLWELVGQFLRAGQAIDVVAVTEKARLSADIQKEGGAAWVAEMLMGVGPSRHILPEYARLIADASLRRRTVDVLRGVHSAVKDAKAQMTEVVARGADAWQALTNRVQGLRTSEGDLLQFCDLADAALKGDKSHCIPTGITALDAVIGGLQSSVLTLVGAYPGVGKSALLATILLNLAKAKTKVGFFSLEDERLWVTRRWLSAFTGIPLFNLSTYRLNSYQMEAMQEQGQAVHSALSQVVIDDRPGLTASEVAAAAKDMVLNHGCRAVIVDHLGEIKLARSDRHDLDVAEALAMLRDVAKRYQVPVVVASHVKRRQGLTVDEAPALTDFANSSAPERMARVALGLSRMPGGVAVRVLKQTNGVAGVDVGLKMVEHAAMISPYESLPVPQENS